ncbi:MAG: response regulator [Defluviitaleaceae bacterium]|nr:response regulator [Defluviitaleaceae bacterium]
MPQPYKVLIVDDQVTNLRTLEHILQKEYTVYSANNGRAGIQCAHKFHPDVILLDVLMPEMDGYDVIKALKASEETKDIPVIFVTSMDCRDAEEKGLALGAADYITKPYIEAIVKLRVRNQVTLKVMKRDLEAAVVSAQMANHAKSSFLANMSHEIRSPMNVIVGLTQMILEDNGLEDSLREHLTKINMASDMLLLIINQILDISKIESGKLTLTPVKYDIASMLHNAVSMNLTRFSDKALVFKLHIDDNLYNYFYGDDLRVGQIINNLLSNAFKYTHSGTITLTIGCTRESENDVILSFSVSDTGIGIRQEDLGKLFTDYNQVDAQANRAIEGTGLGLSITKGLVELMNGTVTVESEYSKGTVFHVNVKQGFVSEEYIDAETAEALCGLRYRNYKQNSTLELTRPDLRHVSVLVVDDYLPNLDVAKWMFGKYKLNVDCVTSGREAIDRVQAGEPRYDAVFMDHMMPGMDGVEATKLIRAIESDYVSHLPIIALTANAVAGNEQFFLDNGFQAFLSKPVNLSKLDLIIRRWLMGDGEATDRAAQAVNDGGSAASPPVSIEIPNINAKLGLGIYDNDVEMYLDILRSFTEDIPAELEKLRDVTEQTLPLYAINVHTVKGSASGIGARASADAAMRLEQMAKEGDINGVLADNAPFVQSVYSLISDIKHYLGA